jgi:heptaprenylglyceryl phosphate synthase
MENPTYGGEMGGMVMIGGSQQEQQDAVLLTPSKISEIEALPVWNR